MRDFSRQQAYPERVRLFAYIKTRRRARAQRRFDSAAARTIYSRSQEGRRADDEVRKARDTGMGGGGDS
jgi:hypothetical protein